MSFATYGCCQPCYNIQIVSSSTKINTNHSRKKHTWNGNFSVQFQYVLKIRGGGVQWRANLGYPWSTGQALISRVE